MPRPDETHPAKFRIFRLGIDVYLPSHCELPETFGDWIELAFGIDQTELNASPTTLQSVVEVRYPVARDVVDRRGEQRRLGGGPW